NHRASCAVGDGCLRIESVIAGAAIIVDYRGWVEGPVGVTAAHIFVGAIDRQKVCPNRINVEIRAVHPPTTIGSRAGYERDLPCRKVKPGRWRAGHGECTAEWF